MIRPTGNHEDEREVRSDTIMITNDEDINQINLKKGLPDHPCGESVILGLQLKIKS